MDRTPWFWHLFIFLICFAVLASGVAITMLRIEADFPVVPLAQPAAQAYQMEQSAEEDSAGEADAEPVATADPAPPIAMLPATSPREVVERQLAGLKYNDTDNNGLAQAWALASPANRRVVGSFERFVAVAVSPDYAPLLNHREAVVRRLEIADDAAVAFVRVIDRDGNVHRYRWHLARHVDRFHLESWATDAVVPHRR